MDVKNKPLKESESCPIISRTKVIPKQLECVRSSTCISSKSTREKLDVSNNMRKRRRGGNRNVHPLHPEYPDSSASAVGGAKCFSRTEERDRFPHYLQGSSGDGDFKFSANESKYVNVNCNQVHPVGEAKSSTSCLSHGSGSSSEKRYIDVIVRIRPKGKYEFGSKTIVWKTSDRTLLFDPKEKNADFFFKGKRQIMRSGVGTKRPNKNLTFGFDYVYGPDSSNQQIFDSSLHGLINRVLDGFNCTIFAYGATGSGKTYTMLGTLDTPGLTVLVAEELYRMIQDRKRRDSSFSDEIKVSYLEVYNETIKDLLNPDKELQVREDGKQGIRIPQLTVHKPQGPQELLRLLRFGNSARSQHATDHNSESSRSHAIFEITLNQHRNLARDKFKKRTATSRLFMVDLAGSEKGNYSLVDGGMRQREGSNINKSLLALSNCINALADGKTHIPYRDSKLTRLLKDSLSGNCVTVMIANISPSERSFDDTHNTLHYANRAKHIKVTFKRNPISEELIETSSHTSSNDQLVLDLRKEVRLLRKELTEERLRHHETQKTLQQYLTAGRRSEYCSNEKCSKLCASRECVSKTRKIGKESRIREKATLPENSKGITWASSSDDMASLAHVPSQRVPGDTSTKESSNNSFDVFSTSNRKRIKRKSGTTNQTEFSSHIEDNGSNTYRSRSKERYPNVVHLGPQTSNNSKRPPPSQIPVRVYNGISKSRSNGVSNFVTYDCCDSVESLAESTSDFSDIPLGDIDCTNCQSLHFKTSGHCCRTRNESGGEQGPLGGGPQNASKPLQSSSPVTKAIYPRPVPAMTDLRKGFSHSQKTEDRTAANNDTAQSFVNGPCKIWHE